MSHRKAGPSTLGRILSLALTTGAVLPLLALLVTSAGCQDHYSTQDAYEICDTLTERNPATNPPEDFLDCVACYETCGGDCVQTGSSEDAYTCPDESEEGGGSSEGGGGGGAEE